MIRKDPIELPKMIMTVQLEFSKIQKLRWIDEKLNNDPKHVLEGIGG